MPKRPVGWDFDDEFDGGEESCGRVIINDHLYLKITLPGSYLLTRAMWVGELTGKVYRNHKKMADDVVTILREELLELKAEGCDFVQFDEPVLTEITMSEESDRRTFI